MAQLNTQPVGVPGPALTLLETNAKVPARADGQPAALEQLEPVAELIQAAGGRLEIARSQHSAEASIPGFTEGCWLRLHSDVTPLASGAAAGSGAFTCYPVRGLRGILAARNANLSLTIVGVSPDVGWDTLRTAVEFATPGIAKPAVGVDDSLSVSLAEDRDRAQRGDRELLNVEYLDSDLCAVQLGQGEVPLEVDVLIVPIAQAHQLARHAAAVSGTRGLQVKVAVDQRGTSVSVLPFSWVNQRQMDPSGAILAAVAMLLGTGQRRAAERLHNGWLATLEAGFHTAALKHLAPYTRLVPGDEFLKAVAAHLDERPLRLAPARYTSCQASASVQQPALRLVR